MAFVVDAMPTWLQWSVRKNKNVLGSEAARNWRGRAKEKGTSTRTDSRLFPYHEYDHGGTREHVFATNGAVALQVPLDTLVVALELNVHTDIALFAVKVITA